MASVKIKIPPVAGEIKARRTAAMEPVFRFQSRRRKEEERFLICEKGPGVCSGNRSRCVPQKAVPGSNLEKSQPHWRSRRQLNRIATGPSRGLIEDTRFFFLSRHEGSDVEFSAIGVPHN